MKLILHYLKEYRVYAVLAPLFKMLEAIFELLVPLVVARMIDLGIEQGDRPYIFYMSLVLLALALFGMLFSITAQYFAAKAAVLSTGRMRVDLFRHIMDFSDRSLDEVSSSTLITRITSDLNQVQGGINMVLRLFLRSPFVVLGAMIMAGSISLKALGLFATVILLLSAVVAGLMKLTLPMYAEVQRRLEGLLVLTRENLEGARVIRAFARGHKERRMFAERNEGLFTKAFGAGRWQSSLNPLTFAAVNMGVVILLYGSGYEVSAGSLSTGEVVALYNYMSQILVELIKFANLIVQITRAYASVGRVQEIMEMPSDERMFEDAAGGSADMAGVSASEESAEKGGVSISRDDSEESAVPAISFRDVRFAYDADRLALEELSFTVRPGETIGIVGGTGAGKSTIARLIRHAYDATEGEVRLFGRRVQEIPDEEMARLVANVPQKAQLFSGTVASNLKIGNPNAGEEELVQALKLAQAWDFVDEKGGLSAEVRSRGSNFSGGQKQRLTIARALAAHPKILILDDSTSALDAATERSLLSALSEEKGAVKIILSQRTSSVMHADRILVMDNGWCVGGGTHEQLLQKNDIYREIYEAAR